MKNTLDEFDLNTGVLIGEGTVFKGELSTEGTVIIKENASVIGNVNAKDMVIAGTLTDSEAYIDGILCLLPKSVVYCNLKAREINSEPGAVFKGFFELL